MAIRAGVPLVPLALIGTYELLPIHVYALRPRPLMIIVGDPIATEGLTTKDADALKAIFTDFPDATITIEGHCDERGSAEYNLALGDRRATAAKDFLTQLGVPADKLKTISYGKERPQCTDHDESCWQKNRRAHFSTGQ